jgi:hypothetical protein
MFGTIFTAVLSAFSAALKALKAAVDYFKTKQDIETGKKIQQAEDIIANEKIENEQNQILVNDRPTSEVIEKLEKGTF